VGSIILVKSSPVFASEGALIQTEVNTDFQNSIIYTSTTRSAVNIGQVFNVGLNINNVQNISAEDITVKYDSDILNFLGVSNVNDGFSIISQTTGSAVAITTPSSIRFIIISNGSVINSQQDILQLNFQSVTTGCGVIYTENGKITDGTTMERKLTASEMGGCIIAKHLGEKADCNTEYTMDLVCDGIIDEKDLEKAKECLLCNSNYNDYECNNARIN
jgi:hypothetical protein